MSFFLSNIPIAVSARMEKPSVLTSTESGGINRRFSGVAYWRGSIEFKPQKTDTTLWGELERASSADGSFYADLYPESKVQVTATWVTVVDAPSGFTNNSTLFTLDQTNELAAIGAGKIVSFRRVVPGSASQQAFGRQFVTARVITARQLIGSKYVYSLETPLPAEYIAEGGAVIEVCVNRPHVRAKLAGDSVQWTAGQPRFTTPGTVEFWEDMGGNLTFLHEVLNSPTGGVAPPLERYLEQEDGTSYIVTEDGRYITTEF